MLPVIKKAIFSSCKTDFSHRSSLIIENYDVLTSLCSTLVENFDAFKGKVSLVAEESIVVEKL